MSRGEIGGHGQDDGLKHNRKAAGDFLSDASGGRSDKRISDSSPGDSRGAFRKAAGDYSRADVEAENKKDRAQQEGVARERASERKTAPEQIKQIDGQIKELGAKRKTILDKMSALANPIDARSAGKAAPVDSGKLDLMSVTKLESLLGSKKRELSNVADFDRSLFDKIGARLGRIPKKEQPLQAEIAEIESAIREAGQRDLDKKVKADRNTFASHDNSQLILDLSAIERETAALTKRQNELKALLD
ncbi:MAG: hypothetical protein EXS55_01425 [Candidatus Magasanikbacteria bacterium]|nr:hypothetical protein [Candidatus Magasanikbacteria bacterium]